MLVWHTLTVCQGISVSAVESALTRNSFRLLVFGNCFPLPVLACSPCHGPRPSLACRPLFGRSLDIGFAIAVATARPASSRCRHRSHFRYSRRRACLPAPASSAGQLHGQRLLAIATAGFPSQPSPPLRLACPQLHVAGKHILLSSLQVQHTDP